MHSICNQCGEVLIHRRSKLLGLCLECTNRKSDGCKRCGQPKAVFAEDDLCASCYNIKKRKDELLAEKCNICLKALSKCRCDIDDEGKTRKRRIILD
jgi:hypothetical protein